MERTYVYDGAGSGTNDALLLSAMNGGMGGFNNPIWAFFLLGFMRSFGWTGNEGNVNGSFVASQLGQAVAGNANAINNLSTHLDCSISQVQSAVSGVKDLLANFSSQTGMGLAQIVNAVDRNEASVVNKLQSCCCDMKTLVTNLNYEGRLADQQQTAFLGSKMDSGVASVIAKLDAIEDSRKDREISSLTAALTAANSRAERAAELAPIYKTLEEIKGKQPNTVPVPWPQLTAIPTAQLYGAYGAYGYPGQWS